MKKLFTILLSCILLLSTIACSSTPSSENDKLPAASSAPVNTPTSATESSTEVSSTVTIEEQVIYDKNGITVTALALIQDDFWGPAIKVRVENTSAQNITVQVRNSSVNNIMIEPMFSCDVAAGKKANDSITFMESELERAGISMISSMEFTLHIFNSDTWDDIDDSEIIILQTSAADHVQTFNDSGFVAYDDGNIKIVIQKLNSEDSFWGSDVYVYAQNNTDRNITIQARDVSIDGFMVDPYFSCDITAGKIAYDTITFMESDLEDNGITDISELELKFHIFDTDSWDTIIDTDIVAVSFE